jgi:hypothetical protein
MNARWALVAGFVSLLATAAGCARPDLTLVAASPRPVPAYRVPANGYAELEPASRFGVATAPRLRVAMRDQAPTAVVREVPVVRISQPRTMMRFSGNARDGALRDHRR